VAGGFIGRKTHPLKARPSKRKPEENPEANKTEEEEKKRSRWNPGKKTERQEDNKIKPAFSPRFQTAAVSWQSFGKSMKTSLKVVSGKLSTKLIWKITALRSKGCPGGTG